MLNMYLVSDGTPEDGSVLVFDRTARHARLVGYPEIRSWCDDIEFTDIRAKRLRGVDFLYKDADQEKLKADISHCVDDPTSCKCCEMWGIPLNVKGCCEDCAGDDKHSSEKGGR